MASCMHLQACRVFGEGEQVIHDRRSENQHHTFLNPSAQDLARVGMIIASYNNIKC